MDLLLPLTKKTNPESFDVTLIVVLILNLLNLPKPTSFRSKDLDPNDKSICAFAIRAREIRNYVAHTPPEGIDDTTYERTLMDIANILDGLRYQCDPFFFRNSLLDDKIFPSQIAKFVLEGKRAAELEAVIKSVKMDIQKDFKEFTSKYKRYVTEIEYGELTRKNSKLRERKFNPNLTPEQAIETNNCVLVAGEAGMGKSEYVYDVMRRWARDEILKDKFIIFISCKYLNAKSKAHPHAAPIYFSFSIRQFLRYQKQERVMERCKEINELISLFLRSDNVIYLVDGIDEIGTREYVKRGDIDNLEQKIDKNNELNGIETLCSILHGKLLTNVKAILFGRNYEIDQIIGIDDLYGSNVFSGRFRKVLKLQAYSEDDVKSYTHDVVCGEGNNHEQALPDNTPRCEEIYSKFANFDYKNIPSFTAQLVEIFSDGGREDPGELTKTKVFVRILLDHLHKRAGLGENIKNPSFRDMFLSENDEYKSCLQALSHISFKAITANERIVKGVELSRNYTYYGEKLDIKILRQLELFYVRPDKYENLIEPHHMMMMEFLAACWCAADKQRWDELLHIEFERRLVILPFIAGLLTENEDIKDFRNNVMDYSGATHSVDDLYTWLFNFNPNSANTFDLSSGWRYVSDDRYSRVSFEFLDVIAKESHYPNQSLISFNYLYVFTNKILACHNFNKMEYLRNFYDFNGAAEKNIETFVKQYPQARIFISGDIVVHDDENVSILSKYLTQMPELKFHINFIQIGNPVNIMNELEHILSSQNLQLSQLGVEHTHKHLKSIMEACRRRVNAAVLYSMSDDKPCDVSVILDSMKDVGVMSGFPASRDFFTEMNRLPKMHSEYRRIPHCVFHSDANDHPPAINTEYLNIVNNDLTDSFFQNISKMNRDLPLDDGQFIIHQFKKHALEPFLKVNLKKDLIHTDQDDGMIMLNLAKVNIGPVSPNILASGLTNIPAVLLRDVKFNAEQWKYLLSEIGKGDGVLRELLFYHVKHIRDRWECLIQLSSLPLLVIVDDKIEFVLEILNFLQPEMKIKNKIFRIKLINDSRGPFFYERVVVKDSLEKLSKDRLTQLENKIKKFDVKEITKSFPYIYRNFRPRWCFELISTPEEKKWWCDVL